MRLADDTNAATPASTLVVLATRLVCGDMMAQCAAIAAKFKNGVTGMLTLIIGLVVFLGLHLLPTNVALRDGLRERFGVTTYKIAYSVASLIGLALIVYGYGKLQGMPSKNPMIWVPPVWTKHLLWALMLPALILLVAANIPSRIRDIVGHPMLLATKIWAAGHLLANGTLAAMVLFGSFLAWAVIDLISAKKRRARGPLGERTGTLGGDLAAISVGGALYLWLLYGGHAKLIGVALLR
ncbi:MAG: NnrU family protein [Hyphomicrobiaceae bacterium]